MLQDLRYALRTLRSQPAVTTVAIVSLALGLATAAGAVSLLDAFGFRPLAVTDPASLVQVRSFHNESGSGGQMSYPDYQDLRDRAQALSALSFYSVRGTAISGPEAPPEVVILNAVSLDFFQTLGITPLVGRPFRPDDGAGDAQPTVVVSYRLWQRRFGGDPGVVHRTIRLNGAPYEIIGVLSPAFTGLDAFLAPDIWIPFVKWSEASPARSRRDARLLSVIGRLKVQMSSVGAVRGMLGLEPPEVARAQGEVDAIVAGLRAAYPETNRDERARVITITEARQGRLRVARMLLFGIVGLVVLVGCANVSGLLLGRAESRRQEIAIRVAIGATRRRLVRQLLTESLILALMAAAAGLLLAIWIIRALPALLPPMGIPLGFVFLLDFRVVLATLAVAIATSVVFGLWPALAASRRGIAQAARGNSTAGSSTRGWSVRNALVVGQVAVSVILLVSGVLLVRSARNTEGIDPGFTIRPLLLVTVAPGAAGYNAARTQAFLRTLVERVGAAPGIRAVSLARRIPLDPNGGGASRDVTLPDRPAPANELPLRIKFDAVAPNYFDVMGTRVVRGRAFRDSDGPNDPKVVLVNETMARRYWPATEAIGRRLVVTGPGAGEYDVIGIVEDGKVNALNEAAQPYMFFTLAQVPAFEVTMIVEAGADAAKAAGTVRDVLRQLDPQMPTMQMLTLAEHMRYALYGPSLAAIIVGSLSGSGLLLSLIGLYGVISFVVARRTKEIGVRMALGAQPADILREVLRHALTLTLCGVGIGVCLALVVSQALASSLCGVSPSDPMTFVGTAAGLTTVALAASWFPARRATKVDPVTALRMD